MKQLIHIAAVEHMSGIDLHAGATAPELNAKLAAYCRSQWATISWRSDDPRPEPPADDADCVETYFFDHENDTLTTGCDSIELPPNPQEPC